MAGPLRALAALLLAAEALAAPAGAEGLNNLFAGLNGLVVAPADPVADAIDPPSLFEKLPNADVTKHVVGFFEGTVFMVYRTFMGAMDIALFPFWLFPTLSPQARWDLVPFYEIQWE
jgi:hypothetical protein